MGFFDNQRLIQLVIFIFIINSWIRYCRRSWPDFVWSLSLPRLAILFDHMSPVHFSSSHSLLAFSTFVSVFYYSSLQISKPSLSHFYLLSTKHDRTTAILSKDSFMPNMSINSSLYLRSNNFTRFVFYFPKRLMEAEVASLYASLRDWLHWELSGRFVSDARAVRVISA